MTTCKFPATKFTRCYIKDVKQMVDCFAYIVVVKFKNIRCKYFNNFISQSKCRRILKGRYDNGRVISAQELEIVLTDVDFKFLSEVYKYDEVEIQESYFARYDYLPKQFIEFILKKYVNKTEYKNVEGKEVEYMLEKNKFNSLYGMSVTNNIKDSVLFDNEKGWSEEKLSNDEIIGLLEKEQKQAFLSFAYGVWVTAWARYNLLKNLVKLDKKVIYADTDSLKLEDGFDKKIIDNYNKEVIEKIKKVSSELKIDINKFKPKDTKGIEHCLGLFDNDGEYEEFITQGAKKYAYTKWKKLDKVKDKDNVIKKENKKSLVLEITVAGVPKSRCKRIKKFK